MKSIFSKQHLEIVDRLRAARLAAGLTQVQVANRLRRPQSFVARLESGQRRIDAVELQFLAKLYGKKITDLLPKQ